MNKQATNFWKKQPHVCMSQQQVSENKPTNVNEEIASF